MSRACQLLCERVPPLGQAAYLPIGAWQAYIDELLEIERSRFAQVTLKMNRRIRRYFLPRK